ncbi:hypothetical protein GCM10011352_10500 [Marinobacterium zhoushanense]|uniref:Uncharacterized protein n=1 Tax=Marinobacterium zhoushanense TaxID=1679163 RepID=A0ABQ1K318_9GAMM|nr:hypothetical protein [Marinobacterium zhoushanense]GGB86503.1 hypothetical protein GCM10011352_10500 [Marinobacterium zhoushanense]
MSEGRFIADTLESVLVGMAESLREAQEELNSIPPLDGYGRPAPQYRIPHLDFEVGFRLKSETHNSGGVRLIFAPVVSGEASKEVTSRITGRFVAVPPGEGMPVPRLMTEIDAEGDQRILKLTATTSAGEVLAGADIELNLDVDASTGLSQAAGVDSPRLSAVTLERAVVQTDTSGGATARVQLGPTLQRAAVIVLVAELGYETLRIVIGKEID